MSDSFFNKPILNSPYEYPRKHWELIDGQPTEQVIERRRRAEFITPIPKPKKRKGSAKQAEIKFDEADEISTEAQRFRLAETIKSFNDETHDCYRAKPEAIPVQIPEICLKR